MKIIARIHTDMPDKFGVPRQSGLAADLKGKIIFEPEYRVREAVKGLDEFSHLWIIWQFSQNKEKEWSPTVRPPRLGGNERKGVFATRSPFRPNPIGLSCVKLEKIEFNAKFGAVIHVSGVDMVDGTPIYDIKPYIAYTDSIKNASQSFAEKSKDYRLDVIFPNEMKKIIPKDKISGLIDMLSLDPRPSYHNDPNRVYRVRYMIYDVHFKVNGTVLTVTDIITADK